MLVCKLQCALYRISQGYHFLSQDQLSKLTYLAHFSWLSPEIHPSADVGNISPYDKGTYREAFTQWRKILPLSGPYNHKESSANVPGVSASLPLGT